ncbi:hypothetical protein [Lacticaseibacillus suihuaensis]
MRKPWWKILCAMIMIFSVAGIIIISDETDGGDSFAVSHRTVLWSEVTQ